MTKKTIGYVELQWTCPSCNVKNPGTKKTCNGCGLPQPANVEFEQPEQQEFLIDKQKIDNVKKGADIHCGFCGARNTADAKICSQCGGNLAEGARRASGKIVGAYKAGPVKKIPCPHCQTLNLETAQACISCGGGLGNKLAPPSETPQTGKTKINVKTIIFLALLAIVACIIFVILLAGSSGKESLTGTVESTSWKRTIQIQMLDTVEKQDWQENIPADAIVGTCQKEYHYTQDEPAPVATEVCGTPYTVDTGSGVGEIVQDCVYEVYEDYCSFTIQDWVTSNKSVLEGNDLYPVWPDPVLDANQRLGAQEEEYTCVFSSGGEFYQFTTTNMTLFQRCQIGSEWEISVSPSGNVNSAQPK
jgi:hypothetical protein